LSSVQLFFDPLQILLNYVLICLRGYPLLRIRLQHRKLYRTKRIYIKYSLCTPFRLICSAFVFIQRQRKGIFFCLFVVLYQTDTYASKRDFPSWIYILIKIYGSNLISLPAIARHYSRTSSFYQLFLSSGKNKP